MSLLSTLVALSFLIPSLTLASPTPFNSVPLPSTLQLAHNEAHLQSRRDGDASWLLREKARLDAKYGPVSSQKRDSSVALADHNGDASYSAVVSIGTPAQMFNLVLDSGSADAWVTAADYSGKSSSTFKNLSTAFSISYGSGSATGYLATDTVSMGGYSVVAQTIAVVTTVSSYLISSPMSGILGMGFQGLAVSGAVPWWQSLAQSSAWSSPLFGVYLARYRDVVGAASTEDNGGSLSLGFTDSNLYSGSISWISVTGSKYWNVPMSGMTVQGTSISLGSSTAAAIDTGTTLIGGPASIVAAIYAAIPGARLMGSNYPNYYEYPCSTAISLTITFGSFPITITSQDFNIGQYSSDSSMCTGGIYIQSLASNSPVQWVLGDTMLKNVYSVYRYSPAAVGFANLAGAVSSSAAVLSTSIPSGTTLPIVPTTILNNTVSVSATASARVSILTPTTSALSTAGVPLTASNSDPGVVIQTVVVSAIASTTPLTATVTASSNAKSGAETTVKAAAGYLIAVLVVSVAFVARL